MCTQGGKAIAGGGGKKFCFAANNMSLVQQQSPATSLSTSCSSSSSSSPDSISSLNHRKRSSPPKTPVQAIMTSTPRQLKYSPLSSPRSSPKARRLFRSTRGQNYTLALFLLVGISLFGSISMVYIYVDPPAVDDDLVDRTVGQQKIQRSGHDVSTPRVVFLEGYSFNAPLQRPLHDDPTLHAPPGEEAVPQDHMRVTYEGSDCIPIADWQTKSFPNCNLIHEMDLRRSLHKKQETSLSLLGTGWFRSAWRWDVNSDKSIVLKTLRLDREFYDEFFDLHRRDAVAMERLSHSPFVMDIYGYCGQSALNELADFNWDSLEKFDRNMRGKTSPGLNYLKLQLASSVAVGLAHVHEVDDRPSMVHYDVNPRNVAIVSGGRPKLNDFNTAEFLRYNPKTNETCGFRSRLHEPWWRAPEEVIIGNNNTLDDKVDVYALGNLIFHILTTRAPRGKMKRERMDTVRQVVAKGIRPVLDAEFTKSKDPAIKALVQAMELCHEPDPKRRPSSRDVASILMHKMSELKSTSDKLRI